MIDLVSIRNFHDGKKHILSPLKLIISDQSGCTGECCCWNDYLYLWKEEMNWKNLHLNQQFRFDFAKGKAGKWCNRGGISRKDS